MKPTGIAVVVLAILTAGSVTSGQQDSSTPTESQPFVELVPARWGSVQNCPTCRVVELGHSKSRRAYYVQAEPVCTLRPEHIRSTNPDPPDSDSFVFAYLTTSGQSQMARCAKATLPAMPDLAVVVSGQVVAITRAHLHPDLNLILILEYVTSLERIRRALE